MTEITHWRGPGPARRIHLPLPEPPRHRHVSKAAREPKDGRGRVLEEWLRDLAVARTHDGD